VAACIRSFTCNHEGACRDSGERKRTRERERERERKRTTLRAVLIVSVMSKAKPILFEQLMVGSGRFDVKHDRVIKLPCSRRGVIMSDAYRCEDVICRAHLPDVIFFSTLKCGEAIYAPRRLAKGTSYVIFARNEIYMRYAHQSSSPLLLHIHAQHVNIDIFLREIR